MSGGHAPYIMPGRHLQVLQDSQEKRKTRSKDHLWIHLQRSKVGAGNEQELQEIRAIERVGHRRRRRWLNDKVLRDMAGPMSAQDMQSQFQPAPFGSYPPPSAFSIAMDAQHAPLWEHFRQIDLDKEAKVLERWEAHNRELQAQQHTQGSSGLVTRHQQQEAVAAAALDRWRSVGRSARAALKKANVHSVLELEMQVLLVLEQDDPNAELLMDLPDGFARLLVHGLSEFHGVLSSTRVVNGAKHVVIHRRPPSGSDISSLATPTAVPGVPAAAGYGSTEEEGSGGLHAGVDAGGGVGAGAAAGAGVHEPGSRSAEWLLHQSEITCSDLIMALHELGSSFDQHALGHYMKTHVHGAPSDMTSDDFVMV